ncbi:MAG: flavodoxin family protein [Anaerovoracaceae bacterium]|jgi:multimeric flavodoxin WrbA
MKALFINGSPRKDGNTARLARALFGSRQYETLNLTEYRINAYGQTLPGDQFDAVLEKMKEADVLVIGSPVYWHNICGSIRNLLDRFYGPVPTGSMKGRTLYFLFQGGAPEKWMLDAGKFTMSRFARLYGMEWGGMAETEAEAAALGSHLG